MSELQEKKFGYVVHPPHHHCVPPCPPPGPIPPGMSVKDWTDYINSYIDVRARQIYDKLKGLIPGGGGSGGEKTTVTYTWSDDIDDNDKTVGTLNVDGQRTQIKVPSLDVEAVDESEFNNAKRIFTFKGIGENGADVNLYCETAPDVTGTVFEKVLMKDENDNVYELYIEGGELKSKPH